jgi:type II secretory pathway pseudopilin PulG
MAIIMRKFNNEKSFSLIELLVVIAIIFILTVLIFANYRSGQQQLTLDRATHRLAQDIRRMQEMAMSTKEEPGCKKNGEYRPDYEFGYGIDFSSVPANPRAYTLFADCNGSGGFEAPGGGQEVDVDYPIGTVEISMGNISTNITNLSIVFTPPDPSVFIKPGDKNEAVITITIGVRQKNIKVNKVGLVDIE